MNCKYTWLRGAPLSRGTTPVSSLFRVLQSILCPSMTGRRIGFCILELREDKEAERGLPRWHSGKESACQGRRQSGRSPGVGNSNPLQYSCLENSMDRGAWQAIVHSVKKSQMQLSDWTHCCTVFNYMDIPWFAYLLTCWWTCRLFLVSSY